MDGSVDWTPLACSADLLGESPFWHPDEQRLYWVDIPGQRLRRIDPRAGVADDWAMPSEPGCIAPVTAGGLVIALRDGIYRAPHWGGALQLLHPASHDTATMRFNDGKADALGRFWAGNLISPRTRPDAALYMLDLRHGAPARWQRMLDGAFTANGLAWSPDARTLYWSDTPSHRIRAWDWDAQAGVLSGERVFHHFEPKPAGWTTGPGYGGRPDGATVDAEGNYWVAMYEGARVCQFAPDGQLLRELPVPAQCPTMPCLGGPDLRTLYVTTACEGRPAEELARYPHSGCVFSTRVEVPGRVVDRFRHDG